MGIESFIKDMTTEEYAVIKAYEFAKHADGYMNFSGEDCAMPMMEKYGYSYELLERMLPISQDVAIKLLHEGCSISILYSDGTRAVTQDEDEIVRHVTKGGFLGVKECDIEYELRQAERFFIGDVI